MFSVAYAQEAAEAATGPAGSLGSFLPIILVFVVFYFLLIRPQQKQAKQLKKMIGDTKKGDRVVLNSGLHGQVTEINDQTVKLDVSKGVIMEFEKSAIQQVKGYNTNTKADVKKKA